MTIKFTMRARIESEIEDPAIRHTIINVLCVNAAKPITKRLVDKITVELIGEHGKADYDVRLSRYAGMTHIEWGGYSRSGGNKGGSILIAYSEKSEPIAERHTQEMKSHLAAIYGRNAWRQEILASDLPEELDEAIAAVKNGLRQIEAIHDAGDNYTVLPSAQQILCEIDK